ncbi:hypothetical protein ACFV1L_22170 [Kitasatospora sp. NPDC059646]|uniref:hypothetical protein n=1 Tax=Kitasatospora sp. NPDC059646 TaxID=3346893 RepID=UPI0036CECBDD
MTVTTQPDPVAVGRRAAEILAGIKGDEEFERLEESTKLYPDCWASYTGYPIIAQWNEPVDKHPLFVEGLRLLALKAAVYELSGGDEASAELLASAPVDEMVHAILAQYTVANRIQDRVGMKFVHMTDTERWGYNAGDYTHQCYTAAFGAEPPERYWIGKAETARRLAVLRERYDSIGIRDMGKSHNIDFGLPALV